MSKSRIIYAVQPCAPQYITEENKFGIDPVILAGGWDAFIKERINPELDWLLETGGTRILVHNPFMVRAGDVFQMDQYIHARNSDLVTVNGFEEAWKPICALGQLIFYFGTLHADKDFEKRKAPGRTDNYLDRVIASVRPVINIGGSIAFDWSNDLAAGSIEYESLDVVRAMASHHGGVCFLEPAPNKNFSNLWSWNSITQEGLWQNRSPSWLDESLLTGEIVRWVDRPEGNDWGGSAVQLAEKFIIPFNRILRDGHTACGPTNIIRQGGFGPEAIGL